MENKTDKEIHKTPLFKQLLKVAAQIILSRFRLLKLAGQAAYKLFHPDTGKSVQEEIKHKIKLFVRMIKAIAQQKYKKFPKQSLIKIVAGVLYFVLVLDILPDFIPFIGPGNISNSNMIYPSDGLSELGLKNGRLISIHSLMMLCIGGSIGKCNINTIDVSCNQHNNSCAN